MAMISFGFTIYKVIQGLQDGATQLPIDLHAARAGMVLTGLGILCLIVGSLEYYMVLRQVRVIMPIPYWRHPLLIAMLLMMVALTIFFSIMAGVL
ncbi:putative membrane protein [Gemmobacter aquatilis]|uniref:Putative membrane protein n=2 Tax=Gemmobacter aquatilis TaxID=933059 RepID=A0A1H7YHA3_9RHOB|nr:putative membrane protein [Gemmobacter aquatilis]